jgi:integrase
VIKLLGIKQAAALWEVDGVQLTMPHRTNVSETDTLRAIERYRNILRNDEYLAGNGGLCGSFRFFGGVSFAKLGALAFTADFDRMFAHFSEIAVRRWAEGANSIKSKEVGIHFVFAEMLRCESDPITYKFMYIFDGVLDSGKYPQFLEGAFARFWTEKIIAVMRTDASLAQITAKIGILRCAKYVAALDRSEIDRYLEASAREFTNRRERISLSKLYGTVFGAQRTEQKLVDNAFDAAVRRIADEEYRLQYDKFPAENHMQTDVGRDVWIFYAKHGPALCYNRLDFSFIESPSLRMEVKYYLKHRFSGAVQIKDRFLTLAATGCNYLSAHDSRIHYFSDIDELDARAFYIALENRTDKKAFSGTMAVFSAMKSIMEYLMGTHRDEQLKSPMPHSNPFKTIKFHNSKDYSENTPIIPELVMAEMDRHIGELDGEYRLLYCLLSETGMRAKEAVFLEADCIQPSRYDGMFSLSYVPYKVLSARRRNGLDDRHRVFITKELAAEVTEQTEKTAQLRAEYGLPYIFVTKRDNHKATMLNYSYFLVKLDQIAERHGIRGDNGGVWHFTARQYRKTRAVELIENGGSIEELSLLLGHLSRSTSAQYYADVRKRRLAEMNTGFFKARFGLRLSGEQLSRFTEAERRALYVDFCLGSRRVELGQCLKKLHEGLCTSRSSLVHCVNCRNLCTGVRYLPYWKELQSEQQRRVTALLAAYAANAIMDYDEFLEYRQENSLLSAYTAVIAALEGGGA